MKKESHDGRVEVPQPPDLLCFVIPLCVRDTSPRSARAVEKKRKDKNNDVTIDASVEHRLFDGRTPESRPVHPIRTVNSILVFGHRFSST